MPFINEDIPEEAVQKYGLRDFPRWTIDHEQDVAVLVRKFPYYSPAIGDVYWKGEKFNWEGGFQFIENPEEIPIKTAHWKNIWVSIPEHPAEQKQHIIECIREAVQVCGAFHETRHIKAVIVEFDPRMDSATAANFILACP